MARTIGPAVLARGTGEGELDVQWLMGVAPTIPTTVWATVGQRYDPGDKKYDNEPFLRWIVAVSNASQVPNVFTISYQDYEDTLSRAFMLRMNTEFAALALRGTTVTTGSGDWGVGCSAAGDFRSDFPSSSPYVLSVGATTFAGAHPTPERGAESGIHFSSGGFSNVFQTPAYQQAHVRRFLRTCPVRGALFNRSGRAFPDVSAVGWQFQYVINGAVGHVGGTSASSPAFAAGFGVAHNSRKAAI